MRFHSRRQTIPDYVDTLDGFRALATFLVLIFHYWQQSWVGMVVDFGLFKYDFTSIVAAGNFGVELLFVLSGFCLYYPLAMHPERRLRVGNYVYKRAVRILPTYFLSVLICSAYQIGRLNPDLLREQFIGNMTLTQMSTPGLAYNHLNPVLWSIAIEVQFYILFPIILPLFRKKPYWVMLGAFLIGESWRMYLREIDHSKISWLMNQLPGMIDTFVGGMLAAHIVSRLKKELTADQQKRARAMFTVAALMFAAVFFLTVMYYDALRYQNVPNNLSRLQMHTRKFLVISFAGAIACSVFSSRWMHLFLGNPVTRFCATISYQVYMWHGWISLRLKEWRIPSYTTERPMDDLAWRWPYLLLCIGLSLTISIAVTYLIERPVSNFCLKHAPRWAKPQPKTKPLPEPTQENGGTANE